jgi:hypothetical protein
MKRKYGMLCSILILCFFVLASCARTSLKSSWKDDSYQKRPQKVFVIGISQSPTMRILFENEFVRQFRTYGIDAFPSHKVLAYEELFDEKIILSKIEGQGIDTVLLTMAVSSKAIETRRDVAGRYNAYPGYHGYIRNYMGYQYTYENEKVNIETGLYEVSTEKQVWSALTKAFVIEGAKQEKLLKSFIQLIMNKMKEDGMLS